MDDSDGEVSAYELITISDDESDSMVETNSDSDQCVPMRKDVDVNLTAAEVYDILSDSSTYKKCLSSLPPVQPKGGTLYVYDLGNDGTEDTWKVKKRKLRCDQYRWVRIRSYVVKHQGHEISKKSSMIDTESNSKGDNGFRRYEYWGIRSLFLIHYVEDHTVFKVFQHRNSKINTKPFVRSAPHVKEKVCLN
jgi:hypothetical protein